MITKYKMNTFGQLLKDLRKKQGLTQTEVARRMGFSNNGYIATVESGRYAPEDKTLKRYAKALRVSFDDIMKLKRKATLMEMGIQEKNIFIDMLRIPLLGSVPCGSLKDVIEETDKYMPVPYDDKIAYREDIFALTADGLSMIEAGILPGDILIIDPHAAINNGDIIVAFLREQATLKYYYERGGYVELRPANPDFKPIKVDDPDFRVVGKLIRKVAVQDYK